MAVVPYTFADQSGQIPLSELDANFANVKAFAETAGNVTGNVQANITAVGTLTSLSVSGNVTSSGDLIGGVLLATSGAIGVPVGVTTLRLANLTATTIWIGGNAGNIYIGNVNSTTRATGNLTAGGFVSATGNITGGNLLIGGLISATSTITSAANITGGNLLTGGLISATSTITSAANIAGGNLLTTGLISASANVLANNLVTSGAISATGNITGGNLSIGGTSTLTGVATAPTAANGTSNTQVATTAFVANSLLNLVPSGVIVMWSGSVASIPTGWLLCNGGNGTPDLRDRFVVGAGTTYTPGNTGGSANAVVVSHSHTASSVVTDPGHSHTYNDTVLQSDYFGSGANASTQTTGTTSTANTGITVATTVNSTGSSATNANLPPYYALAYIMKA